MKIINIILTSQNGGAEQAFIDYTLALKTLGHQVIAILKHDAPYAEAVANLGVEVIKINNNFGYYDYFAICKIAQVIKENDAKIAISHIGRSTVLTKKAIKKLKNNKVLQVAVNHSDNVKRSIGADLIFSVNKNIFYKTIDLGQAEDRSFVIPNAIDLSDAILVPDEIDLAQKNEIVIGAIGRFDRTKGFGHLIKTIKYLNDNFAAKLNKKFLLKLAGAGYFEEELKKLVKELNVENEVEFLGWIKDKKDFFSAIDIFVLPSENEPFGIVLLEAMKFAKPIIATDADGPKEILTNEKDGLIVSLHDYKTLNERLGAAVLQLIEDKILINKMVKNASEKLAKKYSYQALVERFREIFSTI